jgi:peptidyl-prolyl cis-trans isomerase SurA
VTGSTAKALIDTVDPTKEAELFANLDDLKVQLKRDLSVNKLFNKEITSHINISDQEVTEYYNANKASFNLVEPQVHIAQILVTPGADPSVRNLKNDKAQNIEQAKKKIQMLEARLRQGEDFLRGSKRQKVSKRARDAGIVQAGEKFTV